MTDDSAHCPCLSGEAYGDCCRPLHSGVPAPTAERLMRSRFTAFATGNPSYLLSSWHPSTRPMSLDLDPDQCWYRLDILRTERGRTDDLDGLVEFRAWYRQPEGAGDQHEVSRFRRDDDRWYYVDGE